MLKFTLSGVKQLKADYRNAFDCGTFIQHNIHNMSNILLGGNCTGVLKLLSGQQYSTVIIV